MPRKLYHKQFPFQPVSCESSFFFCKSIYSAMPFNIGSMFTLFQTLLKSTGFNIVIMLLVLANAITAAGQHFNHHRVRMNYSDGSIHMDGFYSAEVRYFSSSWSLCMLLCEQKLCYFFEKGPWISYNNR